MAPFGEINGPHLVGHGSNHIQIDSDLGDFLIGGTNHTENQKMTSYISF